MKEKGVFYEDQWRGDNPSEDGCHCSGVIPCSEADSAVVIKGVV